MSSETTVFWKDYYEDIQQQGAPWLDYSNDRVHLQTVALVLEAAGQVIGQRCLELGCGHGHLSRCLSVLGASELVAVDQVPEMVHEQSQKFPEVQWECNSIENPQFMAALGNFDLVFAVEVLQYVPIESTIRTFFERVRSGGRLIGIVPNVECSIASKAVERFDGQYNPASPMQLKSLFDTLPETAWWSCRGLNFRDDQSVSPYEPSSWTSDLCWSQAPNRLMFVVEKA